MQSGTSQALQLFAALILAFFGVIAPIVVILLSIFQEGISKLTTQYENEKSLSQKNLKEQIQKKDTTDESALAEIKETIIGLEKANRLALAKLSLLQPRTQATRLFAPLFFSFLFVVIATLLVSDIYSMLGFVLLSIILFSYSIYVLWSLLGIIIEVQKITNADQKLFSTQVIQGLSGLTDAVLETQEYFLTDVPIVLDEHVLENDSGELIIPSNKKQSLSVKLLNRESRMAKNIEVGFIIPDSFLVDKEGDYSLSISTQNEQIVRYTLDSIHGNTDFILSPLIITPLKQGITKIRTFVKAENIKSTYRDVNIQTTENLTAALKKIVAHSAGGDA